MMGDLGKAMAGAMRALLVIGLLVGCLFGVFAGGCTGYLAGHQPAVEAERQKAIEAGVGRWVVDPATGKSTFVYGAK